MSISSTKIISENAHSVVKTNLVSSFTVAAVIAAYILINVLIFDFLSGVSPLWVFDLVAVLFLMTQLMLVGFALFLGCIRFFWRLCFTNNADINDLFYFFSSSIRYYKSLRVFAVLVLKLLLYALCAFAPLILITVFNASWFTIFTNGAAMPVWISGLMYISSYFEFFGWFIFLTLALKLYPYVFIIVVDNSITALEAAHIAVLLSRNHLPYFVKLCFRNLGWLLSCILILPAFYALPYCVCCACIHSRQIIDSYNSSLIAPKFDNSMY